MLNDNKENHRGFYKHKFLTIKLQSITINILFQKNFLKFLIEVKKPSIPIE